jgi:hypothetical protein
VKFEAEAAEASAFADMLWPGGIPDGCAFSTWSASSKRSSHWFQPKVGLERCAGQDDLYFHCALGPQGLDATVRVKAKQAVAIPGLWLDIDIKGEGHKSEDLPEDETQAGGVMPCEPTLVVHSGGGLQAWWLFEEPWYFKGEADRRAAASMLVGFYTAAKKKAEARGWKLDPVGDLARVFRPPGTFNCKTKTKRPVKILRQGGPRYDVAKLKTFCVSSPEPLTARVNDQSERAAELERLIDEGVSEGNRQNAMVRVAGKLVASMRDPNDAFAVGVARSALIDWNEQMVRPPLDRKEVLTAFNRILAAERDKRIADDFETSFAPFIHSAEDSPVPGAPEATDGDEEEQQVSIPDDKWATVIVDSDPRVFRVYSPFWRDRTPKGYIEVSSADYVSFHGLQRAAAEQARYLLPLYFASYWLGPSRRPKEGSPFQGLASQLLEKAERIKPDPDLNRKAVVAGVLVGLVDPHSNGAARTETEVLLSVAMSGAASRLPDGGAAFSLNWLTNKLKLSGDTTPRNVITGVLKEAGVKRVQAGPEEKRTRVSVLSEPAIRKLRAIANGDA